MSEETLSEGVRDASDDLVDELFKQRLDLLKGIIDELTSEILKRKALRNGALREIEDELASFSSLLNEIAPMGRTTVSEKQLDNRNARRIHLEKGIARLKELRRTHKINTWKDVVEIKKELFKILPEYQKLLGLKKVVG